MFTHSNIEMSDQQIAESDQSVVHRHKIDVNVEIKHGIFRQASSANLLSSIFKIMLQYACV